MLPGAAFASDAMPIQVTTVGKDLFIDAASLEQWPLPAQGLAVHPRSGGTFMRGISWLHRDAGLLSLTDAIARATSIPAQILRPCSPEFQHKGHLAVGADADIAVFDIEKLEPHTDYTSVRASQGMSYVLVGGIQVIAEGQLKTQALAGKEIRSLAELISGSKRDPSAPLVSGRDK